MSMFSGNFTDTSTKFFAHGRDTENNLDKFPRNMLIFQFRLSNVVPLVILAKDQCWRLPNFSHMGGTLKTTSIKFPRNMLIFQFRLSNVVPLVILAKDGLQRHENE